MKRITILAIMALVMLSATAQEVEKRSRWGLRVTADLVGNNEYDVGTYNSNGVFCNFNWTLLYQCFVKKNWYLEPQVSFYHMSYDSKLIGSISDPNDLTLNIPALNLKEKGLGLSIVAGYSFSIKEDLSIDLFVGPHLRYAFQCEGYSGTSYLDSHQYAAGGAIVEVNGAFTAVEGNGGTIPQKYYPAYLNWKVGVGLNYKAFNLTLSGGSGLTNRLVGKKENKLPYYISLGVGYKFQRK